MAVHHELAVRIAGVLVERGETVAVVETSAGGLISGALTGVAGASAWFLGGVVAYAPRVKERWLGLTAQEVPAEGWVSAAAATLMAERARSVTGADWSVAETGIAGPQTGRRSTKPAGLVHVSVVDPSGYSYVAEIRTGDGDRLANQAAFATTALKLLLEVFQRAPRTARVEAIGSNQIAQ